MNGKNRQKSILLQVVEVDPRLNPHENINIISIIKISQFNIYYQIRSEVLADAHEILRYIMKIV
mgnify:CR=1 FL=1